MMSENRNQDVAVVGSPSTNTELTLDLLQEATEERLVGALSAFNCFQNGSAITSVGQIVGIELKNRWHEDSVFRNLIKRTGEIPPITNRQDTRTADTNHLFAICGLVNIYLVRKKLLIWHRVSPSGRPRLRSNRPNRRTTRERPNQKPAYEPDHLNSPDHRYLFRVSLGDGGRKQSSVKVSWLLVGLVEKRASFGSRQPIRITKENCPASAPIFEILYHYDRCGDHE
jgi:hypothetical protein